MRLPRDRDAAHLDGDAARRGASAATQHADGGWGQEAGAPSDVLSTAQAIAVVVRHGDAADAVRALAYLLSRQDADGGFSSPPDQTGPRPLAFDFPMLADIHALSAFQRAGHLMDVGMSAAGGRATTPCADSRTAGPRLAGHAASPSAFSYITQPSAGAIPARS